MPVAIMQMRSSLERRLSASNHSSPRAGRRSSADSTGSNKRSLNFGLERLGIRNSVLSACAGSVPAQPKDWSNRRSLMMDSVRTLDSLHCPVAVLHASRRSAIARPLFLPQFSASSCGNPFYMCPDVTGTRRNAEAHPHCDMVSLADARMYQVETVKLSPWTGVWHSA